MKVRTKKIVSQMKKSKLKKQRQSARPKRRRLKLRLRLKLRKSRSTTMKSMTRRKQAQNLRAKLNRLILMKLTPRSEQNIVSFSKSETK